MERKRIEFSLINYLNDDLTNYPYISYMIGAKKVKKVKKKVKRLHLK